MADNEKCKLKLSKQIGKRAPTSIAEFTNGTIKHGGVSTLHFERFRSSMESDANHVKRLLNATNGRLVYSGESELTHGTHRYYVGVHDKSSGKMKLYDTEYFRLRPMLIPPESKEEEKPEKSYRRDVDDLITNFGSKISKRIVSSRLSRTLTPKSMEESLDDIGIDDSVTMSPAIPIDVTDSIDYIPTRNIDASAPEEVYNIQDIITAEEYEALAHEAERLLDASPDDISKWKAEKVYCAYVLRHLEVGVKDPVKARYLVYYDIMRRFLTLGYTDIRKKVPAQDIPEPFRDRLLRDFTTTSTGANGRSLRSFPAKMKDKLLSYLIVLALFVDDFSADSGLIQLDIKYGMTHVLNVAQILGCHVRNKVTPPPVQKFVELRLPLNVFSPKVFKKKNF